MRLTIKIDDFDIGCDLEHATAEGVRKQLIRAAGCLNEHPFIDRLRSTLRQALEDAMDSDLAPPHPLQIKMASVLSSPEDAEAPASALKNRAAFAAYLKDRSKLMTGL